jgi:hypothetical protein
MRWLVLVGCLMILAFPAVALAAEGEPAAASEVKSAFVYNFLQFTRWPAAQSGLASADLILCAYARGAMADALASLEGKSVDLRRIRVRIWPEVLNGCHVVYLAATAAPRTASILYAAQEAAALTIAEDYPRPTEGVDIGLFEEDDKFAFAINLETARKSGLQFSSKLLRLAKRVYPRPEDPP